MIVVINLILLCIVIYNLLKKNNSRNDRIEKDKNKKKLIFNNNEMEFPIIFPHWRTGDRDSVYDYDFSINKEVNGNLVFLCSVLEENGYGEKANHCLYQNKLVVKGNFFTKYSKDEFLTVMETLTTGKFAIPEEIKFNENGITTIWEKRWMKEDLKKKDYFVSYKESTQYK